MASVSVRHSAAHLSPVVLLLLVFTPGSISRESFAVCMLSCFKQIFLTNWGWCLFRHGSARSVRGDSTSRFRTIYSHSYFPSRYRPLKFAWFMVTHSRNDLSNISFADKESIFYLFTRLSHPIQSWLDKSRQNLSIRVRTRNAFLMPLISFCNANVKNKGISGVPSWGRFWFMRIAARKWRRHMYLIPDSNASTLRAGVKLNMRI